MAENKKHLFRRSHRDVNLYFEGYQRQTRLDPATGRNRTEYVYTGDYYLFGLEQRAYNRFRGLTSGAVLGALALYVLANLLGPQGSTTLYVGVPALCTIIPMIYMLLGLGGLWGAKTPKMTIREYTFGLGRLKNSVWAAALLWGISLVGELVYLVLHRAFQINELGSSLLQLAGISLLVLQMVQQQRVLASCVHKADSRYETMEGLEKPEGVE